MLSVVEALAVVLEQAKPLPPVTLDLKGLTPGLVLAETATSDVDSPPYTKSMMDGYAVRAADCTTAPVRLKVVEEVAAGQMPTRTLQAGEAVRIMTGAPIPVGADAVVMIERTQLDAAADVRILTAARRGENILERGAEIKAGDAVLRAGAVLGPQELGLLATLGRAAVAVHSQPQVAVLPTGDEIVEPPAPPGPGQIRNSNGPMLLAQAQRAGARPRYLGIARDTPDSLRSLIGRGLSESDALILSGGVSAGKFDLVPGILEELGVKAHFHKVLLKPGKPLLFGSRANTLVFGLPGNPVSSFVCFELFIRPALRKLLGHAEPGPRLTRLPIASEFRADNDRPTYWPARVEWEVDGPRVRPLPWRSSADLRALHTANALLVLPPGAQALAAGEMGTVIVLE
jgi:molybdopterin molybdotransferase